jgi:tape measure domain-containing protein
MALNLDTAIRISANFTGRGLDDVRRNLQGLAQQTTLSRRELDRLYTATQVLGGASGNTVAGLQRQIAALRGLRDQAEFNSRQFRILSNDIRDAEQRLSRFTQTTNNAARQGSGRQALGGALGTLATGGGLQGAAGALAGSLAFSGSAGALGAAAGITAIGGIGALAARVGVDAETAQVRLKALTDQFGEYNQAQAAAARISETLRISTTEAQDGFSKLYGALRPTGVTLQEIEDAFVGFTAAARASGATAVESSSALLQLKQALGSGVLQGDELRSIREQAPAVGQAIAREMGVTIGELKKLGSEGQITTDIVLRALAKLKGEKLDQLNDQFKTSAQTIADLRIATEDFGRTVAKVFGPTAVSLLRGFTEAIRRLNDATVAFRDPSASTAAEILRSGRAPNTAMGQNVFLRGAQQLFIGTSGAGGVGLTGLEAEARDLARTRRQPYDRVLFELMQNRLDRLDGASGGNASQQAARDAATGERQAARDRAAAAAAEAAEKEAKKRQKELEKLQREQEKELKAQLDFQNDLFDIRLNFEKRLADFREQSLDRAKQMERDIGDQRLQLERKTEELRRRAEGQTQDFFLKLERNRVASIGGDTSSLDFGIEMTRVRRDTAEQIIRNEQEASDRRLTLDRAVEDYRLNVAKGIRDIQIDAAEQQADRIRQGAEDAAERLRESSIGGSGSVDGSGPSAGVARLLQAASSKLGIFAGQTERCADAIRELFKVAGIAIGTTKKAWDGLGSGPRLASSFFGSDIGQRINNKRDLRPGDLVGFERTYGSWGPGVQTHVGMYAGNGMMFDHSSRGGLVRRSLDTFAGKFMYGVRPYALMQGGQQLPANGIRPTAISATRNLQAELQPATPMQPVNAAMLQVPGMDGINAGVASLQQASDANLLAANADARSQGLDKLLEQDAAITQELGQQKRLSEQQLEDYQRILALQRSGLSPELAQQSVERARMAEREATQLQALENQTVQYLQQAGLTDEQRKVAQLLLDATRARATELPLITGALQVEAATLERLRDLEAQRKQLIEGITGSISNGLTSAMDALIDGTENWGNSLRDIASGVLRDIAKQLVQIYAVQPATKGLQGLLGSLLGGGGSAGAAAAAGAGASVFTAPLLSGVPAITGAFANGGIMTDQGPLPLRAYSNGGIATGPQLALFGEGRRPEAYVPLPDGRRIPVAMQGGGGSNVVNVTVNAEGSAVQGDSSRSEQLGQVVARAIQEEMIRQRRPGGLLAS